MIKNSALVVSANVVKEELRQQCLLDAFTAAYFGVKPDELEPKYPESSHMVLVRILTEMVGDQTLFYNWLFDEFDKKAGIRHREKTRCGKEVTMVIRTAEDLSECISVRTARLTNNCDLCRDVCRKCGLKCK